MREIARKTKFSVAVVTYPDTKDLGRGQKRVFDRANSGIWKARDVALKEIFVLK